MKPTRTLLQITIVFLCISAGNSYSQFYDLVLEDMSINEYTAPFIAENSITASDFMVSGNGDVTFKAGNVITLLPGFSVVEGGQFHALISDEVLGSKDMEIGKEELSNYPNPFSGQTTINFSVPKPGKVKLTVINPAGQTIATLFDRNVNEIGVSQEVSFDADGLSEGIYFYKLESPDKTIIKKMVLSNP